MCSEFWPMAVIWGGFALVCVVLYATPFIAHAVSVRGTKPPEDGSS